MKQKTHKALASRLKITKTGKMIKRRAGQDHFNAGEKGKVTRNKRRDQQFSKANKKAVQSLIPTRPTGFKAGRKTK